MFNKDFSRVAFSVIGAFIFSATAIAAAVGPARMVETTPLVYADVATAQSAADA